VKRAAVGRAAVGKLGRPRSLSRDEELEVTRRYALWYANQPKRLADEFGVSNATISVIARRVRASSQQPRELFASCLETPEGQELINNSKETS
jgi:hypothetical protein